ncbi:Soluble guanylate cyclase 88E [Penaeus vannamei]|uniref:Soluble guanylate cyclase 88E n=1 Tax=Penaeus vannamei TaxID=6689 RepID=A0A423TBW2_PENVA|nr:Soluble guanylate cyclase 88E [Penaeus vannamei]
MKLPRYCLFGDTRQHTASRMQTNSQVGKIHISEICSKHLEKFNFLTTFRGKLQIKVSQEKHRLVCIDSLTRMQRQEIYKRSGRQVTRGQNMVSRMEQRTTDLTCLSAL